MANLLSTNVTGTINSTGNTTAAGFTGNANVGGTGSATWHPSGIYSGSTQWLYGTTYRNNAATYNHGNLYFDGNYGYGMVGLYASTRYQAVFAMGDSYKLPADGTGTGTLYGIAWTHTNVGGESKPGLEHQALFMMNGRTYTAIGSGIWTDGTITTTSHGTSANWNTAYGWGNHASAGYQAASTAITTSNIGSQSVSYAASAGTTDNIGGVQFRNTGSNAGTNADTIDSNGITYYNAGVSNFSGNATDGALYSQRYSSSWQHQIAGDYRSGQIALRGRNNGTWQSWRTVLDSSNFTSWAQEKENQRLSTGNNVTFNQIYSNDWFRANGTAGLYFQTYGYGLRAPEAEGNSYGNVATYGTGRNGWSGYGIGSQYAFMGRVGSDVGLHDNNYGWSWYWHAGNRSLGIGESTTSASYRLYVTGAIYATDDIVAYSDSRKKTNIETIPSALDTVLKMRGVFYDRIDGVDRGRQLGVIAQEVEAVLPEAVSYAADLDEYGVKYGNIVGVLIEAIKEQQAQIDELKKRLGE